MITGQSMNEMAAALVVEELVRNGVDTFCYGSGSRSSPLVVAVARNPKANSKIHLDERGVGFFAVGYARAAGRAAAIITTSGTAAANLLPAVIEARQAGLPLIVLTADRPPEMRDAGANQTMRQPGMFAGYPKWNVDVPCPDRKIPAAYLLTTVDQACYTTLHPTGGPVHLNCMFREPLAPVSDGTDVDDWLAAVDSWRESGQPYTRYQAPGRPMPPESRGQLRAILSAARRGVVIIGELRDHISRDACLALVDSLGWPAFADVSSGLRLDGRSRALIPYYDLLLADPQRLAGLDTVLHVGGRVVSQRWLDGLAQHPEAQVVHLAEFPERLDPTHQVRLRVEANLADACLQLCAESHPGGEAAWVNAWRAANTRVETSLTAWEHEASGIQESWIARRVASELPDDWGLVVSSSMPIRDVNRFAGSRELPVPVACNRGVSGIDGTVSTAVGFSNALHRPVTLLIGDLALLHDLNALYLVRHARRAVVVVVINNNGGGIFHFLPIHQHADVFETHFGTPHGLGFRCAAEMYGLVYAAPASRDAFEEAYLSALEAQVPTLIEVLTDREQNLREHQELEARVRHAARGG